MPWLELTETVVDQEATNAAQAKAAEETEAAAKEAKEADEQAPQPVIADTVFKEETRKVETNNETRVQIPSAGGYEYVTFGETGVSKIELTDAPPEEDEKAAEAPAKATTTKAASSSSS